MVLKTIWQMHAPALQIFQKETLLRWLFGLVYIPLETRDKNKKKISIEVSVAAEKQNSVAQVPRFLVVNNVIIDI